MIVAVEKTNTLGNINYASTSYGALPDWFSNILETAKDILKNVPWVVKSGDWVVVYNPNTKRWELYPKNVWEAMKSPTPAYDISKTPPVYYPSTYTPTTVPTPTPTPTTPTVPAIREVSVFEELMPFLMIGGALLLLVLLLRK